MKRELVLFTELPFGLCRAGYVFTKLSCPQFCISFWVAHCLLQSRNSAFLCPVTGSRWLSADLRAGRFVLGGGLAHRMQSVCSLHGKCARPVYNHVAIWFLQSLLHVCVNQVVTPMHCFVIGEADILKLSNTLMTVYVQRMMGGRNVCDKPVGVQHSGMSGVCSSHY